MTREEFDGLTEGDEVTHFIYRTPAAIRQYRRRPGTWKAGDLWINPRNFGQFEVVERVPTERQRALAELLADLGESTKRCPNFQEPKP